MTEKRIILLKSQFHKVGGLEKYAWQIAKALAAKQYRVDILTTGKKSVALSDEQIDFHYFDTGYGPNFMRLTQFDSYCNYWQKQYPAQIVLGLDRNTQQTHIRAGNGVHLTYLKKRKNYESFFKSLSFSINPLHKKILEIEKTSFESPTLRKLITNSAMIKQDILNHYNVAEDKIAVLHNGVEWKNLQIPFDSWQTGKDKLTSQFRLSQDAFHFLFIGSGFDRKGLKPLLQALALLKDKEFYLSVLGNDKHMADYIKLVKKLRMTKKVFFFGTRCDTTNFLQMADCLVLPSFYDPFANVTLEALAMGVYVITSKSNGAYEILSDFNGIAIENPSEIEELSIHLKNAMENRKTTSLAQKLRDSVKSFDFSIQLDKFITLLETT